MKYQDVIVGSYQPKEIELNPTEMRFRIGKGVEHTGELFDAALQKFYEAVDYKYVYVKNPVRVEGDLVDFGFAATKSRDLAGLLRDCREVFFMAVTAGIGVDRLVTRTQIMSKTESYFIDGIGSTAAESLANRVNEDICRGLSVTRRFSPGYGDVELAFQIPLLERVRARDTIGILLSDSLLMTPLKSITAIIGILPEGEKA